jgi:UDP-N-acetyl-D-mannosaminuronic acid transferase (WecB/TagA/CpsF family)
MSRQQSGRISFHNIASITASNHQIVAVGALSPNQSFFIQVMASSMAAAVRTINNMGCVFHDLK